MKKFKERQKEVKNKIFSAESQYIQFSRGGKMNFIAAFCCHRGIAAEKVYFLFSSSLHLILFREDRGRDCWARPMGDLGGWGAQNLN